jgi:tetratricopeptide (TPR) repeat protein
MAVALYRMGRHKEALIMFRKAVGKDPSYRNAELLKTIHFWKPDWIRDVQSLLEDSKYKSTKSLKHPKKDS